MVDYEKINKENHDRYGWDVKTYGQFFEQQYSNPSHYILELIQNARDAYKRQEIQVSRKRTIDIRLEMDHLEFRHFGIPFDEQDVRGICEIGGGTKREKTNEIGEFGIGFKSVYACTRQPEVHCGDEHFVIEDYVRPKAVSARETSDGETLIYMPFESAEHLQPEFFNRTHRYLNSLSPRILLFLGCVDEMKVSSEDKLIYHVSVQIKQINRGIEQIVLSDVRHGRDEKWFVFSYPLKRNGKHHDAIRFAFQLKETSDKEKSTITQVRDFLYVYFPTNIESHCGFVFHAPFELTPNREGILKYSEWNEQLSHDALSLLDLALKTLKNRNLLNAQVLDLLPVNKEVLPEEYVLSTFRKELPAFFSSSSFIPRFGKGFSGPQDIIISRGSAPRELLNENELTKLFSSENKLSWASEDIMKDRFPHLYRFLRDELGIKVIDAEWIVKKITEAFLKERNDMWMIKFYRWAGSIGHRDILKEKPIIRLEDNPQESRPHVAPYRRIYNNDYRYSHLEPNVFLPSNFESDNPTVKSILCKDKEALEFLKSLGLKPVDMVDEIIDKVLKKKYNSDSKAPTVDEYISDMKRVVSVFNEVDQSRKLDFKYQLENHKIALTSNPSRNDFELRLPEEASLFEKSLDEFQRVAGIGGIIPREVSEKVKGFNECFKELGASEGLRVVKFKPDLDGETRDRLEEAFYQRKKWSRINYRKWNAIDYKIIGLETYLKRLSNTPKEETLKLSILLWNLLKFSTGKTIVSSSSQGWYSWSSRQHLIEDFDASYRVLLKNKEWVVNQNGELCAPMDIPLSYLQADYTQVPSWLEALFAPESEIMTFAKKQGLPPELLQKMIKLVSDGVPQEQIDKKLSELAVKQQEKTVPTWKPQQAASEVNNTEIEDYVPPTTSNGKRQTPGVRGKTTNASKDTGGDQPEEQSLNTIEIGRWGEERVYHILKEEGHDVVWMNEESESKQHYDIKLTDAEGELHYIEVKSKSTDDEEHFPMSGAQWQFAKEQGANYWVYVVSNAGSKDAKIRKVRDPHKLWTEGKIFASPVNIRI